MEIMIILIFICIFLFVFAYMFDWIENYFWEDDVVFRKIMNYIRINQNKLESDDQFIIEIEKLKVSSIISYRRIKYDVYFDNKNINYLLNDRQIKYICNYVNKIYLYNEKRKFLYKLKNNC